MHDATSQDVSTKDISTADRHDTGRSRRPRSEAGMTTAEYTVGTLGACSVAAVLIKIAQTPWFGDLIKGLLENIVGIAGF